jgi:hypothetical protein
MNIDRENLYFKIFLALMIFITNMFNRDEVFFHIKEKFKIFYDNNHELSKYILSFSLFFSFTKNFLTAFIGMCLIGIFDNLTPSVFLLTRSSNLSRAPVQAPVRFI